MIELMDVCFSHASKLVLRDFSFFAGKGERVVLWGPSGSGKTTVLRLIAGLIPPSKGVVKLDGIVVSQSGEVVVPPEQRKIGYVFQDLALWPHMRVRENLEFPLVSAGIPKPTRADTVRRMLALTGASAFEGRYPGELSGGEQQRVAIARALVLAPRILLMDEPLSNLDDDSRYAILERVLELHTSLQFTLIYVTHRRDEAKMLCARNIQLA